jgi:hypothetical protein
VDLILIFGLPVPAALACTPPPGGLPPYTVADRVNAAEVVLEGTIIALTNEADPLAIKTATVEVKQYFKGTGPVIVTIAQFGPSSLCLSPVFVGQSWIFYAAGDPQTGLTAHYLSQFDAVDPATTEVIAQVIATLGYEPVSPYGYWVFLPVILKASGSGQSR